MTLGRAARTAVAGRLLGTTLLVFATPAGSSPTDAAQRQQSPAATPLPALPPALIDDTLDVAGAEIEGRKVRSRMTVPVRINGQGPFRFVVDSGADTSVIGERAAKSMRLPAGTPVTLHGITASGQVDRVLVDSLGLGEHAFTALELPVLKDADLGGAGMLGIDALVEQRLLLDFEKRIIKVEDAARPARRLDGEIVVTARRLRGQLILTQARANGRPVNAVIDTGSEITIGNLQLRDQLARRYGDRFTTIAVTGVTGVTVDLQLARIAELRLGSVLLQDVPIAFADVPPFRVFGLADQPALLLGTDLMETFRRVSLDFRRRKVRFQLRRCRSEGVTINTSAHGAPSRISMTDGTKAACVR
ncbi:MAG: Retroviral aspartyl protease [Sphingomonas bacterium]|uniref:retroviral-like aspartic protease family protein n=1 Tax=Sphingomonas bacterium TaxID=1895847 RepID=UPI002623173B|nr:retroviral-like aspartic protease family protein [Sphingomonas bacterium]MDB5696091.1 Retroviral aspartyl protease [Sphingomonas bacterium]